MDDSATEENILITTHGGWILTFLDNLLQNPDRFKVENLVVDETIRSPMNTSATKICIKKRSDGNMTNEEHGNSYSIQFLSIFDAEHLKELNGVK